MGPKNLQTEEAATSDARATKKPLALLVLADDEIRSYTLLRSLTGLADEAAAWGKLPFAKDSDDLKRWKVTAPGALVLLDATQDPPKLIKVVKTYVPAALKKEILDAAKAVATP